MSEATDMLTGGLSLLLGQLGVTFTVSGVTGSFTGIPDGTLQGNLLTTGGMREDASLTLVFARGTAYTPAAGDIVTAKGQNWAVVEVGNEAASYTIRMEGRSQ